MRGNQRREILVTAITYPELSTRYRESACTGGVFLDDRSWCRIYPVPIRYLNERIHLWDVIRARVWEPSDDPRPESRRVDPGSIERIRSVPTGRGRPPQWDARREILFSEDRMFESLESLQACQTRDGTSLGMVTPRPGVKVGLETRSEQERKEWNEKLESLRTQGELFPAERMALDFMPYRLRLQFECSGSDCIRQHDCGVLDWGVCQMIRRDGVDVARQRLRDLADSQQYDLRLMMGNFRLWLRSFGVVGLWYPKRASQLPLV